MHPRFMVFAALVLLVPSLFAETSGAIPVATVIAKVKCSEASQSYAVYLPSAYSAARKWPILYLFDPAARGERAVEVVKNAAERFGYIVAASNNSRNGPLGGSIEAATAMWKDTHQRFSIDERRRYLGGMSGGARVATSIALACQGCVAGVIANAAGFPINSAPNRDLTFAYFAAVGNADFNYPEFVELRRNLTHVNARHRIRVFDGTHGWAPAQVWLEALDWMDLQAILTGQLPRELSRIQAAFEANVQKAHSLESSNDLLGALREYESIVRDFAGLTDVAGAKSRAAELKKNKFVKVEEKRELSDIATQTRMTAEPSAKLQAMANSDLSPSELMELRNSFIDLKNEVARSGEKPDLLVARRALGSLVVQAFESGQHSLEQKDYRRGLAFFDLAATGSQDSGWVHLARARAFAMAGEKRNMLSELKLSLAGGIHDAEALNVSEFDKFRNSLEFQALAREWKNKVQP